MQRIVFINLHATEFLVKTLGKYLFKHSCAFKHKYFLEYLLDNPDVEVCNYVNRFGFSLFNSLPQPVMWFLRQLRFMESRFCAAEEWHPEEIHKGNEIIKDNRPDDIVIGKRDALHEYLAENGVGTVIHYPIAPHKQECYANEAWNTPQLSLPITEKIADEELSLPIGPAITMEEVKQVVELINRF